MSGSMRRVSLMLRVEYPKSHGAAQVPSSCWRKPSATSWAGVQSIAPGSVRAPGAVGGNVEPGTHDQPVDRDHWPGANLAMR
jgi:hypothetical protein